MFISQMNQTLHHQIKLRFVNDVCFQSRCVSHYAYVYSRRLCSKVEILMNRSSSASSREIIFNIRDKRPLPGIQHKISSRDIDMPVSDFHVMPHGKGTPFNLKSTIGSLNARFTSSLMSAACSVSHLRTSFDKFNYAPVRHFSTRNISGRLFYRRRPKMVPRYKPKNRRSCWLEGCPQKKGVCVTIRVVTPRKPNSGLRKVARVRLSTGRTVTCHVPGEGHNLHTHSVVLVRGGRCQDVSGCHYKVVRSKYDLLPVKNRASSRSKYGVRLSDAVIEKRRLRKNQLHVTTELDRELFNSLYLNDWINHDGSRRLEPLGPDDPLPVDIFSFNSRLRNIIHNSKS